MIIQFGMKQAIVVSPGIVNVYATISENECLFGEDIGLLDDKTTRLFTSRQFKPLSGMIVRGCYGFSLSITPIFFSFAVWIKWGRGLRVKCCDCE
jgi:hypothetical protein